MTAVRRCKFDINQLNSFSVKVNILKEDNLTSVMIEVKLSELESRWVKMKGSYEEYIISREIEEEVKDDITLKYEEASENYEAAKIKLVTIMKKVINPQQERKTPLEEAETPIHHSIPALKLPACEVPVFEGGYFKWPAFRDLFQAVIGKHPHLVPAQRLYHLHSKTKGEPNQIVSRFDLVDENFSLAWEALTNRYENPRILANHQMKLMFSTPSAQNENPKSIRHIQSILDESLKIFESLNLTKSWDAILVYLCTSRLPEETMRSWENTLQDHKVAPTWKEMSDFLSKRIEILETVYYLRKPSTREHQGSKNQSFHIQKEKFKFTCKRCKQNHPLRSCIFFKSLSVSDRIKYVFANKYCVNCLSPNHYKSKCESTNLCTRCNQKHHTMLHREDGEETGKGSQVPITSKGSQVQGHRNPDDSYRVTTSATQRQAMLYNTQGGSSTAINLNSIENTNIHFSRYEGTTILPTALVYIEKSGDLFCIRALLDAGSEKSFISKKIQQQLDIPVISHKTQISGLGGTVVGSSKSKCVVTLQARTSDFKIRIQAIVVSKLTHLLPSQTIKISNLEEINHLTLADPFFYKPGNIDMIIGSDYLPFINREGVQSNILNCLEARESNFGWYLSGPAAISEINTFSTLVSESTDSALEEQIKKFWDIEEINLNNSVSEADQYCENHFISTTSRGRDGRYVVRLPFKEEFPDDIFLGSSRHMALAQYHRLEHSLNKNPELKNQYMDVLQEYYDLDHMEPVTSMEPKAEKIFSFYLPHHAVVRPQSKSTKIRVVFNASKKTTSGFSLNDILHQGPTLQKDLVQIVLCWRNYQYVFTGDIEKMYRQILIHQADRAYQRLLFRPNGENEVKTFQLKTVTFGINCAPFLAIRTLLKLSQDCKAIYPRASEILKNEIYVDDILSGGHTLEEATEKQHQIIKALASAGFPLKKLTANNKILLHHLPREDLLDEEFLKFDTSSTIKTLGIYWNALSDTFYYILTPIKIQPSTTKRQILSVIARLFDPIGWLGPIVIIAKLLMQDLWQDKAGWDEVVSTNILVKWNRFLENLPKISSLHIPRWVSFSPTHCTEIHGFCDASEKAYCGAVYMRTIAPNGEIRTNLLVAKTRVAPLKKITIPKLELCGAVLLTKLIEKVTTNSQYDYQLYMWTDSSILLGWLQKSPESLKAFVANRIKTVLRTVSKKNWKHVQTVDNPADLGTRGCYPQELAESRLWWHGPDWLSQPAEFWPKARTFEPTSLEVKRGNTINPELVFPQASYCANLQVDTIQGTSNISEVAVDALEEFSSLDRALRVICYRFRIINRILKRPFCTEEFITTEECRFVKNRLILLAQKIHFPKEYSRLLNQKALNQKSRLLSLSPFIDKDGLLRVGGRLNNSGLSYEERHPVIIPDKSRFAVLFVEYTHRILLHSELQVMLRAIRQGFYIPRVTNLIRKCIRGCKTCVTFKQKFQHQIMAALPPERVTFSLPFTYTGVDFAGPFSIKSSNLKNAKLLKGYAAIFVCFSTRAVHLEACSELSTDAFMACFDRFVGRRGLPKTMFSDNGRNFLGASYVLLKNHNVFLKTTEKSLVEKYNSHGFKWSFIPPYAPHMGGLWEAAVKSMKTHLKKVAKNLNFTFEEFATLLIKIEAILNSRPMSPMTQSPNELLPLTPGHFLRGEPLIAPPEAPEEIPHKNLTFLKRYERLKALQHMFARRWKNEYITELQRKYKWRIEQQNLKNGDFVIVKDDLLPPTEWRLGRITRIIYGQDGKVRVAELKTQNGHIIRPIVKLCLLPDANHPSDSRPLENKLPNKTTP